MVRDSTWGRSRAVRHGIGRERLHPSRSSEIEQGPPWSGPERPGGTVSYLLRLVVPDRPGILGAVATALGDVGVDIVSLDVLERGQGVAVDDVVVDLPPDRLPGSLITAGAAGAGGAGGGPGAVAGAP